MFIQENSGICVSPFFSVVIPAFNAEKFVLETLNSVVNQTFGNYEIIVVDDGSTDNTYRITKEFLDAENVNYRIIKHEKNRGIGAARNTGIKNSKGKYIAFLDADDIWYKYKLQKVYEVLSKNPNVNIACHDEYLVVDGKIVDKLKCGPFVDNMYEKLLFEGNCLSTSATVVEKDKLIEVGLFSEDLSFNGVEDYELWLRLAKLGCYFYFLHEVLGEYRMRTSSISSNITTQIQNESNVIQHHLSSYKFDRCKRRIKRRYAQLYFGAGRNLHRLGNFPESIEFYLKAIKQYPLLYKIYLPLVLAIFRIRI